MSCLARELAFVTRHLRNLRGTSHPILAEASDGGLYVVKLTDNLVGPNLPFNESMGTELYRACGLPVAPWKPLLVPDAFLDQNPACWLQTPEGTLRPTSDVCFGSRFLGGEGIRLFEILPESFFKRVQNLKDFWLAWLVDICATHSDKRQSIFRENTSGGLVAVFIDHGHMFGGPKGDQNPHFRTSRYLDTRIYDNSAASFMRTLPELADSLNADQLWDQVQALPNEWKLVSAVENFASCLDRLSDSWFLQNVLDTMMGSHRQASACEHSLSTDRRAIPVSILRPSVHSARRLGKNLA
jgi:hypothetical protein